MNEQRPKAVDPTNTDGPPACSRDCRYRQRFDGHKLQANALRMETGHLVETHRCGWNIKPGAMGGHPLNYAPCTYTE